MREISLTAIARGRSIIQPAYQAAFTLATSRRTRQFSYLIQGDDYRVDRALPLSSPPARNFVVNAARIIERIVGGKPRQRYAENARVYLESAALSCKSRGSRGGGGLIAGFAMEPCENGQG